MSDEWRCPTQPAEREWGNEYAEQVAGHAQDLLAASREGEAYALSYFTEFAWMYAEELSRRIALQRELAGIRTPATAAEPEPHNPRIYTVCDMWSAAVAASTGDVDIAIAYANRNYPHERCDSGAPMPAPGGALLRRAAARESCGAKPSGIGTDARCVMGPGHGGAEHCGISSGGLFFLWPTVIAAAKERQP